MIAWSILLVTTGISGVLYYIGSTTEYMRANMRARIASQWRIAQIETKQRLDSEELNQLLRSAGVKMSAPMYNYLRLVVTGFVALFTLRLVVLDHNFYALSFPVAIWFIFDYKKPWPMYFGFQALHQSHANMLNKQLFQLFALVKQELEVFRDKPRSIYDVLKSLQPRVPLLSPALTRCLVLWQISPANGLESLALDIGTEEAKQFSDLLMEIERSESGHVLDVLISTHVSFREKRVSLFAQRIYLRSLIGTAIGTLGLLGVAFNFQEIIQVYTQTLMNF